MIYELNNYFDQSFSHWHKVLVSNIVSYLDSKMLEAFYSRKCFWKITTCSARMCPDKLFYLLSPFDFICSHNWSVKAWLADKTTTNAIFLTFIYNISHLSWLWKYYAGSLSYQINIEIIMTKSFIFSICRAFCYLIFYWSHQHQFLINTLQIVLSIFFKSEVLW